MMWTKKWTGLALAALVAATAARAGEAGDPAASAAPPTGEISAEAAAADIERAAEAAAADIERAVEALLAGETSVDKAVAAADIERAVETLLASDLGAEAAALDIRRAAAEARLQALGERAKEMRRMARSTAQSWERRWRGVRNAARLGVFIKEADEADGVVVVGLIPGSGANQAGVLSEDLIVEVNGESLRAKDDPKEALREALRQVSPGDTVRLVVLRDGRAMPIEVVTDALPAYLNWDHSWEPPVVDLSHGYSPPPALRWTTAEANWQPPLHLLDIGQDLGEYFGVDSGVLVLDTPAKSALKPGDVLRRIDGADVASVADARRLLATIDDEAEAEVLRKKRNVKVAVKRAGGDGAEHVEVEVRVRDDD